MEQEDKKLRIPDFMTKNPQNTGKETPEEPSEENKKEKDRPEELEKELKELHIDLAAFITSEGKLNTLGLKDYIVQTF